MNQEVIEMEKGNLKSVLRREREMEQGTAAKEKGITKKRGRKKKEINEEANSNKEQNKFFIDVSKGPESKEMILNLLSQINTKSYGREIILKDLVLAALPKLTSKDIEKIQENSLTEMEKVERAFDEYNKKNDIKLSMGEYLVKRLGIS